MDVEANDSIRERKVYENEKATDKQALDENGVPCWSTEVDIYNRHTNEKEGSVRLNIHSRVKPAIENKERHPVVTLSNPYIEVWNTAKGLICSFHCTGVELTKAGK
jgi:hypothetical protein